MIDIHAHYDDKAFDADRYELVSSLFENHGLNAIINAGCDIKTSLQSIALAEKFDNVYATVGFHPNEVENFCQEDLSTIKELLKHPKVVAIGEIGLDYHYGTEFKEQQKKLFRKQLELAIETDMPVVIHERDSVADCLEIVSDYDVEGVFHAFSGSTETASILLKRGWYISFSGTVTFKNARHPVENASFVPENRILTETDSPYLTAHPFRGKRNDSSYMRYTLEKLAEIRNISFDHIERVTEENAKRLFRL